MKYYSLCKYSKYFISDKFYILLTGYLKTGKIANIKKNDSFYDKMQYLKINKKLHKYTDFVDKYKVREYIERKIGDKYLIPLLGVYKNTDEINFERLPNKFVLKANHSSGQNLICKDKSKLNIEKTKKKISSWLNQNFYYKLREIQYRDIEPAIVCEKYIEDKSGQLMDYKFFCSNGKPEFIELDMSRFDNHKRKFFDLNWNVLNWKCRFETVESEIEKPDNLEEMINIAKILSEDFPFVRVDLYSVEGKIYFGELTFSPGAGLSLYEPYEVNNLVGSLIDISKY